MTRPGQKGVGVPSLYLLYGWVRLWT